MKKIGQWVQKLIFPNVVYSSELPLNTENMLGQQSIAR